MTDAATILDNERNKKIKWKAIAKSVLKNESITFEDAVKQGDDCLVRTLLTKIEFGSLMLAIKRFTEGEFDAFIKERYTEPGYISRGAIYNAMSCARFVMANKGLAKALQYESLGAMKQLMLAAAKDVDIDPEKETVFGIDVTDINSKPYRQLKKEVDQLKEREVELKDVIEQGTRSVSKMRKEIADLKDHSSLVTLSEKELLKRQEEWMLLYGGLLRAVINGLQPIDKASPFTRAQVDGFFTAAQEMLDEFHMELRVLLQPTLDGKKG